jgi:signal transduction histidine kinase
MSFDLFKRENEVIEKAQALLDKEDRRQQGEFQDLLDEYKKLSKASKRIVRLSDRNEQQLRAATEEIARQKEELERTQESLVQAEKLASLGELVAGVAHELNTPLGIILTAASSLNGETDHLEKLVTSGKARKSDVARYISTAKEVSRLLETHSQTAADLIGSFKSVSADRASDEKRTFYVAEYIQDILRSLEPSFKGKKVEISFKADDDVKITSYPGALNQIITNLVLNSLKHGFDEGRDEGTIFVHMAPSTDSILITVEDNGKGIEEGFQKKIFDPFVTTARDSGGTGLGLNIVHNLVVGKLGGSITLKSKTDGSGTCFSITLPLTNA